MFSSLLNGRGDYHGFGLPHSIKKRSNNDLGITVSDYGFHFSDNTSWTLKRDKRSQKFQ